MRVVSHSPLEEASHVLLEPLHGRTQPPAICLLSPRGLCGGHVEGEDRRRAPCERALLDLQVGRRNIVHLVHATHKRGKRGGRELAARRETTRAEGGRGRDSADLADHLWPQMPCTAPHDGHESDGSCTPLRTRCSVPLCEAGGELLLVPTLLVDILEQQAACRHVDGVQDEWRQVRDIGQVREVLLLARPVGTPLGTMRLRRGALHCDSHLRLAHREGERRTMRAVDDEEVGIHLQRRLPMEATPLDRLDEPGIHLQSHAGVVADKRAQPCTHELQIRTLHLLSLRRRERA